MKIRTFTRRPIEGKERPEWVPLEMINVLIQSRRTFTQIHELANSIARNGVFGKPQIACYDLKHCREYLELIAEKWQVQYDPNKLVSFVENGKRWFFVLIDGERRYRAFTLLKDCGCDACRSSFTDENGCLERHFPIGIPVDVKDNIDPIDALTIQYSSNSHVPVPLHEEADGLVRFYHLLKERNPGLTNKAFGALLGRPADLITRARRLLSVPDVVFHEVVNGEFSSECAIHLGRLVEAGLNEKDIMFSHDLISARGMKPTQAGRFVSKMLADLKSDQMVLFSEPVDETSEIERLLNENTVKALFEIAGYFDGSRRVFERRGMNNQQSPFAKTRSVKALLTLLEKQESLLPHLRAVLNDLRKPSRVTQLQSKTAKKIDNLLEEVTENADMAKPEVAV